MFKFSIEKLEKRTVTNEGSFLQTPFWTDFKQNHGWKAYTFKVHTEYPEKDPFYEEENPEETGDSSTGENCSSGAACSNGSKIKLQKNSEDFELTVLNRSFCKGFFSLNYVPLVPSLPYKCTDNKEFDTALSTDSENSKEGTEVITMKEEPVTAETQTIEFASFLSELSGALRTFLPKNSLFIRFDPDIGFDNVEERSSFNFGMQLVSYADRLKLYKAKNDIQPPDTTLVDLTPSEEEILNKMHSKWRYNIRLAQKKGVVVEKYTGNSINLSEKVDIFYELTKETNARDGNSSHAKEYYKDLLVRSAKELQEGKDSPEVSLYIASSEGDEIASIITLFSKTESVYLYGASSNRKRNLMPNYLLQWTAIKDAKAYGSSYYDLYGLPPEGKDENHPMHGLYLFKSNFGGRMLHRTGSWDYPYKYFYRFYRIAENLRAFWHKKVVKKMKHR